MAENDIFLNCITVSQMKQMKSVVSKSRKLFILQTSTGEIINSEKRFFHAVHNANFPMNPPGGGGWGGLADSLFGGFNNVNYPYTYVHVIWPFADDVAASNMLFLMKTVKWLKDVAFSVSPDDEDDPDYEEGGVILQLFLVCSNEKRKKALETEFWFLD